MMDADLVALFMREFVIGDAECGPTVRGFTGGISRSRRAHTAAKIKKIAARRLCSASLD
jgi:hypothetical protein